MLHRIQQTEPQLLDFAVRFGTGAPLLLIFSIAFAILPVLSLHRLHRLHRLLHPLLNLLLLFSELLLTILLRRCVLLPLHRLEFALDVLHLLFHALELLQGGFQLLLFRCCHIRLCLLQISLRLLQRL